jgi:phage terminase small subunit
VELNLDNLDQYTRAALAPSLTEREKELRDVFVKEYIVDFDRTAAALRCGFAKSFATDYANKFMDEPYVRKLIQDKQTAAPDANVVETDRLSILAALRREMVIGSPASRVSAATQLAKLQGLEPASKTISEVTVKSPVQFYLPHNGRDNLDPDRIVVKDPVQESK